MLRGNAMSLQRESKWFWLEWTLATLVGYTLGILALLPWAVGQAYAEQPGLWVGVWPEPCSSVRSV